MAAQGDPRPEFANAVAHARESAWKAITSGQGSGVSVAIMERGSFAYSEGIGVADRARNRAVDRHTRFNIGSVAKMFAAASILMLVDEGKVELDAPVVRYIPEFTMPDPRYRDITVRMLLNHSAGLPGLYVLVGFEPDRTTHAVLLDTLTRSRLKHAPGAMSMYSNDGFTLAEIVIERVSGRKFMDFLAERIFVPLGMTHTSATVGEISGQDTDNVAEYYDAATGKKYPREVLPVYAAGGISSTAEDLCRFGNALIPGGTPLLSAASLHELMQRQPTLLAGDLRHAPEFSQFGWDWAMDIGGPGEGMLVLSKGGNTTFYTANLQILPAQGLVVALIVSGRGSGDRHAQPILTGLLQDRNISIAGGVAPPPPSQVIPAELDRYRGYYATDTGVLKVSFDRFRRRLTLVALANPSLPLVLTYSNGYFYGSSGDTRYYFLTGQGIDALVASTMGLIVHDSVAFQKLDLPRRSLALAVPMEDESWLIRNAPPLVDVSMDGAPPMLTSRIYKEVPGHVVLAGVRRIERPDFAAMAATGLRDQNELALVPVDGQLWVRTANILRSPARDAAALTSGATSMTIGSDGYNEWRAVAQGTILRFELPRARSRAVIVAADTVLHDSLIDGNEAYAPEGSYLFFAGEPGDTLRVVSSGKSATTH